MSERIIQKTNNLRFIVRENKYILQQQYREVDSVYVNWQGPNEELFWIDIPVENEQKEIPFNSSSLNDLRKKANPLTKQELLDIQKLHENNEVKKEDF